MQNKPINKNIIAIAICTEWMHLMFKPDRFGKASIDLRMIKDNGVSEALNQIRRGVDNYKRAMMACNKIDHADFATMQDFAAFKFEVLTTLAEAFIPLDEDQCGFLVKRLEEAVMELDINTQKHPCSIED